MEELLFLAHRIPYPPDKGDKIRSWNFLKCLAQRYRVHLGCFIDDRRDWEFTDFLRGVCQDCFFAPLKPRTARLRSLRGLFDGRPLTLPYYFDAALNRWVRRILARPRLSRILVYCSAMAQYVPLDIRQSHHCVTDVVDVDSEKWFDYARKMSAPKAWICRREGARLRRVEREIAATFKATLVATPAEQRLYQSFAPESAGRIVCIHNGVDSEYFSPDLRYDRPAQMEGTPLVFVGAMDYWPNVDAVIYFSQSILPLVRTRIPNARFIIVGSNPKSEVKKLDNGMDIFVTGRVSDTRPFAAYAKAIVAPLRIARGVQNKVLEGMSMGKPVVASPEAVVGIVGQADTEFLVADNPDGFVDAICKAVSSEIGGTIGSKARQRILTDYEWSASVAKLEAALNA
jgi:sugar transferase (PEP-CTERM/EpsH1 system associated)